MLAFFSRSSATKRSLPDASGSLRILASCARCAGRSRWFTSWIAVKVSSVRASGAIFRMVLPSAVVVETPLISSLRYGVGSSPSGNIGL